MERSGWLVNGRVKGAEGSGMGGDGRGRRGGWGRVGEGEAVKQEN